MIDWSARLAPGEALLWQGRPEPPPRPVLGVPMDRGARIGLTALLGGLIAVLVLLLVPKLGVWAVPVLGPVIGGLAFGIWFANGGQVAWTRWSLARTRYALTDRRALVARRVLGRWWVASTPVARFTPPRVAPQGATAHLVFRSFDAVRPGRAGRQSYSLAFRFIPDAARVRTLIEGLMARL